MGSPWTFFSFFILSFLMINSSPNVTLIRVYQIKCKRERKCVQKERKRERREKRESEKSEKEGANREKSEEREIENESEKRERMSTQHSL